MESDQTGKPVDANLAPEPDKRPEQPPASSHASADEGRVRRGFGRRGKMVGSPLLSVPERRKELGRAAHPDASGLRATPIQLPQVGQLRHGVGPARQGTQTTTTVRPPVTRATAKPRHRLAFVSFLFLVVAPVAALAGYLFTFAQDQYASEAGFSVRKDEGSGSIDMIGGLTQLTGSASTDAEILYDFIRSPDLVAQIDKDHDLFGVYGRSYAQDPLFSLKADATIEEKQDYWQRMVTVEYNEATGLIRLEVRAFSAPEAQTLAAAIIEYSSSMINQLSDAAREDATRYARAELEKAVAGLKVTRTAITKYRSNAQVIDPLADIQGQMGLMNNLEAQLAEALIQLGILNATVTGESIQVTQIEQRIEIIEKYLAEERAKFGIGEEGTEARESYAEKVAEYERLVVEREVAEERFRSTTLLFNAAEAEANRKSRYLAAHIEPTLAEGAVYPQNALILATTAFFLILAWALAILVYYSIRDRR